jgi:hypothetical protein
VVFMKMSGNLRRSTFLAQILAIYFTIPIQFMAQLHRSRSI